MIHQFVLDMVIVFLQIYVIVLKLVIQEMNVNYQFVEIKLQKIKVFVMEMENVFYLKFVNVEMVFLENYVKIVLLM